MAIKLEGHDQTKKLLDDFSKQLGKGVEEGIKQLGQSSARALAMRVQPYGLSQNKGQKFIENIRKQVNQVWIGVNLGRYKDLGGIENSHRAKRGNRGRVLGERITKEKGDFWNDKISIAEKERYAKKQQLKAGRAKAAWITCGKELGLKMSGIGTWIKRHVGGSYGKVNILGKGIKAKVEMHNKVKYLTGPQKDRDVRAALKLGRINGLKRMKTEIAKHIAKFGRR